MKENKCLNPIEKDGELYCETDKGYTPYKDTNKSSPASKAIIGVLAVILVLSALTVFVPGALFGGGGDVVIVDAGGNGDYTSLDTAIQFEGDNVIFRVWDGTYMADSSFPDKGYTSITSSNIQIIGNGTGNTVIAPHMPADGQYNYPLLRFTGTDISVVGVTFGLPGQTNNFGTCIEIDDPSYSTDFSLEDCEITDGFRNGVDIGRANNVHILNNTISIPNWGPNSAIFTSFSAPNTFNIYIDNNVITGGGRSIGLEEVIGEVHITDNEINSFGAQGGTGIWLNDLYTDEVIIDGNTISGDAGGEDTGIYIDYDNVGTTNITGNTVNGYTTGVRVGLQDNNLIRGNMIDGSSNTLLYLTGSTNNMIYRNIFLNGVSYAYSNTAGNTWNETYENGGGNYWDEHTTPNIDEDPYFVDEPHEAIYIPAPLFPPGEPDTTEYDNLPWASPMIPDIWPILEEPHESFFNWTFSDVVLNMEELNDGDDTRNDGSVPPVYRFDEETETPEETSVGTTEVLIILSVMTIGTVSLLVILSKR